MSYESLTPACAVLSLRQAWRSAGWRRCSGSPPPTTSPSPASGTTWEDRRTAAPTTYRPRCDHTAAIWLALVCSVLCSQLDRVSVARDMIMYVSGMIYVVDATVHARVANSTHPLPRSSRKHSETQKNSNSDPCHRIVGTAGLVHRHGLGVPDVHRVAPPPAHPTAHTVRA